jgi:hypothetical protein
MKIRFFLAVVILAFIVSPSIEAQAKKRLAILPFSGGDAQDGETISILLSNQRTLLDAFTVQPRNSAIDRIMGEQQFQRQSGLINVDAISEVGKLNTADLVVSGYIAKLNETNLILISIIDVTEIQQIAGVYQTYRSIEEIRGLLPGLSQRLVEASRRSSQNLPSLAVPSFSVPSNVNATDAMVLAQILATEITNSGKYAVFPRTNSVDDVLREARFQRSGQTADAMALGTSRNIDFILSSNVLGLGRMNLFAAQILNIEGGNAIIGADREYQDMSDGVSKDLMREIASELTGSTIPGSPAVSPAVTPAPSNTPPDSRYIVLANARWRVDISAENVSLRNNIRAIFNIANERIDGQAREVLTLEADLGRGSGWRIGQFILENATIVQQLQRGSGVRFKVLGDGKTWKLQIPTREANADSCYYETTIATRNGRVVDIDIPYSRLRQPSGWGRRVSFIKNSITCLSIQRHSDVGGTGASTIKIFDFEIY